MMKRVRDKLRIKPIQVIPYEEWEDILNRFIYASGFMQPNNIAYQILTTELKEAEAIVLENRIHEVREIRHITDIFQKVFVIPRKEQLDELIGQIKFIRGYLAELQSWIDFKTQCEKSEADGKITIRRNKDGE